MVSYFLLKIVHLRRHFRTGPARPRAQKKGPPRRTVPFARVTAAPQSAISTPMGQWSEPRTSASIQALFTRSRSSSETKK